MIGGAVSNVLGGFSNARKLRRIEEFLIGLGKDLHGFRSEVSERYVNTEEFEDLLEQTLRRVADERHEEKRRYFRKLLDAAIKSPGDSYDEQLKLIHTLEQVQPMHIRILRAVAQEPTSDEPVTDIIDILCHRLPDVPRSQIVEIREHDELFILGLVSMLGTADNAPDLREFVTPYGRRFLEFISG